MGAAKTTGDMLREMLDAFVARPWPVEMLSPAGAAPVVRVDAPPDDWADTVQDTFYTLDADNNVIPATPRQCEDMLRDIDRRRVGRDVLPNGVCVSTVFLGIDHNFGPGTEPVCFESMAFPPVDHVELACERYGTWAEAAAGHAAMVGKFAGWVAPAGDSDAG